jgi:hypothetical protein
MSHAILGFLGVIPVTVAASIIGLSAQGTDGKVQPWDNNVTWKVNVAKSTYNPATMAPKSRIAKREPMQGGFKVTVDQVSVNGQAIHTVTTAKYDGKDNPVEGAQPPGQTQAYRLIDGGYEIVTKLNGKVMTTNRFQVSRDGNTITQTVTGNDVQTGQKVNHTVVWEKQ